MEEILQISRQKPKEKSKDYNLLREQGLRLLQELASETWTDHNIHDPGITILENLCYTITELGVKTGMDIESIIAAGQDSERGADFFSPAQILTIDPITINDYRKLLVDLPEIKNAWVEKALKLTPAIFYDSSTELLNFDDGEPVELDGILDVLLEFAEDPVLGDLNSTIITLGGNEGLEVFVDGFPPKVFFVEVNFPFWEDERVADFAVEATIDSVSFLGTPNLQFVNENEYFSELSVSFNGGQVVSFGISSSIRPNITAEYKISLETAIRDAIVDVSENGPIPQYHKKLLTTKAILKKTESYLHGFRNFSEDFNEFKAVRIQEIGINAQIDITPGINPEELLADIYFRLDQFVAPAIQVFSLEDLKNKKKSLDQIFKGPLLDVGFIEEEDLDEINGLKGREVIYSSDIIRIILEANIQEGEELDTPISKDNTDNKILSIRNFTLSNFINNRQITGNAINCLTLVLTETFKPRLSLKKSNITFSRLGVHVPVDQTLVEKLFQERKQALNKTKVASLASDLIPLSGDKSILAEYYSIQHDFPSTYGLAEGGLSSETSPSRIAQSRQLRAYLLFFEQILANYASQLAGVGELLSINNQLSKTYSFQIPDNIPGLEKVISQDYEAVQNTFFEELEVNSDRGDRVMDHLLARHGENAGRIEALRAFENSNPLGGKQSLLQQYADLGKSKASAFKMYLLTNFSFYKTINANVNWRFYDFSGKPQLTPPEGVEYSDLSKAIEAAELVILRGNIPGAYKKSDTTILPIQIIVVDESDVPIATSASYYDSELAADTAISEFISLFSGHWNSSNVATLKHKICLLLGISESGRKNFSTPIEDIFTIVSETNDVDGVPVETFGFELNDGDVILSSAGIEYIDERTVYSLIDKVVRFGILPEQYQLIENSSGGSTRYSFELVDEEGNLLAIPPGSDPFPFNSTDERRLAIERVQEVLLDFTPEEGFHFIEHILLRPIDDTSTLFSVSRNRDDEVMPDLINPYSFQISIVLPGIAGRFANKNFRDLVEQTFYDELPAHIFPRIFWLNLHDLYIIEDAYKGWIDLLARPDTTSSQLKGAQDHLVNQLDTLHRGATF
jgi:hypothetical protein